MCGPYPTDPFQKPAIQPNYLAHETGPARRGCRHAPRPQPDPHPGHGAPMSTARNCPAPLIQTDDELLDAARRIGATTYHPMGTCRMSPTTDPTAVVDDQLRVHGMQSLRVVDASVMPRMMSANLAAGTMMIAEKASDIILGKPALEPIIAPD